MHRVSVIIPNYNYAQYIEARINSVLHQTYQDIEIILLDDCSTDNSLAIMQQMTQQDKRIRTIIANSTNSGSPFAQWKKGIEQCQSEYIWIAEADDLCQPQFLETAINALEQYTNAAFAITASQMINEKGQNLQKDYDHWNRRKITPNTISIYDTKYFIHHMQYWRNHIYNASGVVFRRNKITTQALQSLSMHYSGDWLFWTELALQGPVIEIHQRLNLFRFHEKSTTHLGAYKAFLEDVDIVHSFEEKYHIPFYKQWIRTIKFVRRLRRMNFTPTQYRTLRHHILHR